MQDAVMSGLFGALSNETRMNLISNNLANINTTGYKRDRVSFQDTFLRLATDYMPDPRVNLREKKLLPEGHVIAKPRLAKQTIDMSQGSVQPTGNALDLAISGTGFFKVITPQGVMYTRNGEFYRNADGLLVDTKGYPVAGGGGTVALPDKGKVTFGPDGRIFADSQLVGTLDMVKVQNEQALERFGQNYFTAAKGQTVTEQELGTNESELMQGYLEKPNVEVVTEMVNMIETQHSFEAYQKAITGANDMDSSAMRVGQAS
ncbi:MAG: flagellar basal-body rod protein FlgF [Desulfovibrionaceae bacterium]|nr:flagellar basal-body rod protein FlgF [Desulfovibrionaceae bacterium]MBF0512952.1 flagellar basal-body rod protein FlgF [Desulfovibrionaceae bacterium]